MKTELIKWMPDESFKKGELYELDHKAIERIVLCTGEGDNINCFSGVVVHNRPDKKLGHHSAEWLKERFKPFRGSVKLNSYS